MKKKFFFGAIILSVYIIAFESVAFSARTGAFVGIGAGDAQINTPKNSLFVNQQEQSSESNISVNKTVATKGGIGVLVYTGYNFSENFGIEASYIYYPTSRYSSQQTKITKKDGNVEIVNSEISFNSQAYNLVGKTYYDFNKFFQVFARVGASYVIQRVSYSVDASQSSGFDIPLSDEIALLDIGTIRIENIRPLIGVGAGFNFTDNIGVDFSLTHIGGRGNLYKDKNAIASLDMVALSFVYYL